MTVLPSRTDSVGLVGRFRRAIAHLKEHRRELFWVWIGYQTVKGVVTTSIIWIPLALSVWR